MRALAAAFLIASCVSVPESHEFSWLSGCFNDGDATWRWQQADAADW